MTCAHDHLDLGLHLAHYLHDQGVVLDPAMHQPDEAPDLPAIFIGDLADTPDRAVGIIGPWHDTPDSDHSALVRFMTVTRSPSTWDPVADFTTLTADCQDIFHALHRPRPFQLTASRSVLSCERIVSDPPVQDANRRWRRVDTYIARLNPPTST